MYRISNMIKRVGAGIGLLAVLVICAGCGPGRAQMTLQPDEYAPYFEDGDLPILNTTPGDVFDLAELSDEQFRIVTKRGIGMGSSADEVAAAYGDVKATLKIGTRIWLDDAMTLRQFLDHRDEYETDTAAKTDYDYAVLYETIEYQGDYYAMADWNAGLGQVSDESLERAVDGDAFKHYYLELFFTDDEVSAAYVSCK
ncbi:hypothetical protein LJC56_10225 [Christensenellaceae bacterium OttesenSCG-928-K19]|nr:hypothetical protein [Christensenellaceae bacterium OttesenSCG-928-K19]